MNCPNCNAPLPEGGFFCPECGTKIQQPAPIVMPVEIPQTEPPVVIPSEPVQPEPALFPEEPLQPEPVYIPEPPVQSDPAPIPEGKAKEEKKGSAVPVILLAVLLAAAIGLNVWQYLSNSRAVVDLESQIEACEQTIAADAKTIQDLQSQVADEEAQIQALNAQITSGNTTNEDLSQQVDQLDAYAKELEAQAQSQEATIQEQLALIETLQPDADNYARIIQELAGSLIAYGSENYYAETGLVVMSLSEQTTQFYLEAKWEESVTVNVSWTGDAAEVNFCGEWNGDRTQMIVTAKAVGASVATFTNSVDDATFKVLILVTE